MGVGKSTLVGAIACEYGLPIYAEHFRQIPYWKDSYTGKNPDFMKMQIAFLVQYLRNIESMKRAEHFIADNQFYAGPVFVHAQHMMNLLSDTDYEVYMQFFRVLNLRFPREVTTIVISDSPQAILGRVRSRSRKEEASVELEYIDALCKSWELFTKGGIPCGDVPETIVIKVGNLAEGAIPKTITDLLVKERSIV